MNRKDAKSKSYQGYRLPKDEEVKKDLRKRAERAAKNSGGVQTNETFAITDPEFKAACEKADVKPTARQASKFRNGYGKAAYAANRNHRKVNGLRVG